MKKNTLKIAVLTFALFIATSMLSGCGEKTGKGENTAPGGKAAHQNLYQCPMHPQIIKDKPGQCPICGMNLVPIDEESEHADHSDHALHAEHAVHADYADSVGPGTPQKNGSARAVAAGPAIRIDPAVVQNIGVRTEPVRRRPLAAEIRLDGKVSADESRVRAVTARVMGYVERLHASVSGQAVRPGQVLLELYSPDLVAAQEEFLQAVRYRDGAAPGLREGAENLVQSARRRLLNWDVPPSFLAGLEQSGQGARRVPIASPLGGVVLRKNVIEGQSVMPGMELFQIADLSRLWVTARVYQNDLAVVRVGSSALLRLRNLPGREFKAKISFISPEMDPATRTVEIRMEVANTPGRDLKPEMFAEVTLQSSGTDSVIAVPEQALIRSGRREVAVVALGGGRFQPREIKVGRSAGGYAEILEGLAEGDTLVTSAQFLIDSESNLRAAVEQLRAAGGSAPPGGGHAH